MSFDIGLLVCIAQAGLNSRVRWGLVDLWSYSCVSKLARRASAACTMDVRARLRYALRTRGLTRRQVGALLKLMCENPDTIGFTGSFCVQEFVYGETWSDTDLNLWTPRNVFSKQNVQLVSRRVSDALMTGNKYSKVGDTNLDCMASLWVLFGLCWTLRSHPDAASVTTIWDFEEDMDITFCPRVIVPEPWPFCALHVDAHYEHGASVSLCDFVRSTVDFGVSVAFESESCAFRVRWHNGVALRARRDCVAHHRTQARETRNRTHGCETRSYVFRDAPTISSNMSAVELEEADLAAYRARMRAHIVDDDDDDADN